MMFLNSCGNFVLNLATKLKTTPLKRLAALVLLLPVLLMQNSAFGAAPPPPLSWGYLTKIGDGYNYTGQVIGVDYKIYRSPPASEITNLVVTLQTNHAAGPVTCTSSTTESAYICSVRHTIVQADIDRQYISLDASFTAKHNGADFNGFIYTSSAAGANNGNASSTSPNFGYFPPATVYTPQTITHNIPASVPFDAYSIDIALSSTSGIGMDAVSTNNNVCSISKVNNVVKSIDLFSAGVCSIEITAYGGTASGLNYQSVEETVSFTISRASNTISFAKPADTSLSQRIVNIEVSASSRSSVFVFSQTPNVCDLSSSTSRSVGLKTVGECRLRATNAGNNNYLAAADVVVSFNVTKLSNVITFDPLEDKTTLDPAFQIFASASSTDLAVSFSTTSTACSVSGDMVTPLSVGSCAITASQSGNTTYASAAPVTQTFNVSEPPNTISFSTIPDKTFGDAPFAISASATSNLPVTVSSDSPTVCTISGLTVTMKSAGKCVLVGKQGGNSEYPAAADETVAFAVNKATTTATLDPIAGPIFATQTITLTARVTGQSPTGTVTFRLNVGTAPSADIGTIALNNGVATTTYQTTTDGDHTFGASYGGDDNNRGTKGEILTLTVDARPANASQSTSTQSGVQTQQQTMQRFGAAQNTNIGSRLQGTRTPGSETSFALQLQFEGSPQLAGLAAAGDHLSGLTKGSLPFGMWIGGTIGFGSQDNSSSGEDKFKTSGLTIGFDHRVNDSLLLGVALGMAVDETKIGTDGSKVDGENVSASLYASYKAGPSSYFDILAGYGAGELDTARYDTLGAVMLYGDRDTSQFFGSIAFTYEQKFDGLTFAPYVKARAEHTKADAYAETGSAIWALAYDDMSSTSLNAVAGFDARYDMPVSWGSVVATGGAEFSTQIAGNYSQGVGYADGAGGAFTITDAGTSASQLTVSAGLATTIDQLTLDVLYKFSLANQDATSHAISGTLRYEF